MWTKIEHLNYCAARSSLIARSANWKDRRQNKICLAQRKKPNFRYSFQNIILPFLWRRLCIWYLGDYMQWGASYEGNYLLVKRLNVETKQKQFLLWSIGNHSFSVVWRSHLWLVTIQWTFQTFVFVFVLFVLEHLGT